MVIVYSLGSQAHSGIGDDTTPGFWRIAGTKSLLIGIAQSLLICCVLRLKSEAPIIAV